MSFIPSVNTFFPFSSFHSMLLWILYMPNSWKSEKERERFLAYQRKRKKEFKEKGICPSCTKNPSAPGRTCCQRCLDDKKLILKFGTAGPYRQLYADLFEGQRGLCGICRKPMTRPVLDHCHDTMIVRGLLCSNCNIGLGQFKDSIEILTSAMNYIKNNAGIGIVMKKPKDA